MLKEKIKKHQVSSEPEEEHDGEEIKSTSTKTSNTGKVVAGPYQKRKPVRSQQQALSQLSSSVDQIVSVQMKKHKLILESDLKRERMY